MKKTVKQTAEKKTVKKSTAKRPVKSTTKKEKSFRVVDANGRLTNLLITIL